MDLAKMHGERLRSRGAASFIRFFAFHTLARAYAVDGNYTEASAAEQTALALVEPYHLFLRGQGEWALAEYLTASGDAAEAEAVLRRGTEWRRQQGLPEHSVQNAAAEMNLAEFYLNRSDGGSDSEKLLNSAATRIAHLPMANFYRRRLDALKDRLKSRVHSAVRVGQSQRS